MRTDRILILDGGFGTMLQAYDLGDSITRGPDAVRGCNDLLSITRPDIVGDIHDRYLRAGADIISTNSFNANAISLADYGLSDRAYDIARAAAGVARAAADRHSTPGRPRYVAGSMGPTNRALSISSDVNAPAARDVTFQQMCDAYATQARGLVDGGADLLLVETAFDALNAKAAIHAIRSVSPDIPVMLSATVSDASGRLLTGQTIEAFCAAVMHARPISIGLNCGCGARHLMPYIRQMAQSLPTMVSVHPNAGLPNVDGGYDETPQMFADDIEAYMREGLVNIVGGCCGTTPDHISAIARLAPKYAPRVVPQPAGVCTLSGLEPLVLRPDTNFVNIGERTNVAGSAKFARLIREGQYAQALEVGRAQVAAGAQIVDVCMDDALIDGVQAMTTFVNLIASEPDIARVPLMIDSSRWEVIEAGLRCTQGKGIVNSISLKEGEQTFLDKARRVMSYGAAVVVMLFDEQGQADTYQRKVDVARRAYDLLRAIDFPPEDIIIDPNILAVGTGIPEHDRYARDFIEATRWIKANLPGAKVSGGVSNLSFAFRGNNELRRAMHAVFLLHAINAGMDMAIVNPQMVTMYDDIEPRLLGLVEDLILYRRADAAERLALYAKDMTERASTTAPTGADDWHALDVEDRIEYALLRGETSQIADDALLAYQRQGSAIGVIDNVLMPAMARVGQLFGQGKMFLPQVVKSARVMKMAVAAIEPYIGADNRDRSRERKDHVVLATVKGDVHDIGKNIVGVVLACNGYEVVDLGVMVPPETIIDAARSHNAVAICLSGLITPSLDEMTHVAEAAEREGLDIPIIIGGATTSDLHTALKIAPVTRAAVIHSRDAADNASILAALTGERADEYIANIRLKQRLLVEDYQRRDRTRAVTVPAAGCPCGCGGDHAATDHRYDTRTILRMTPSDVADRINWSYFLAGWGLPGRYPDILSHPTRGQEVARLMDDARQMLRGVISDGSITLQGVVHTVGATADGDDIVLEDGRRLAMLRDAATGQCVADMVDGRVTLFAMTSGVGLDALVRGYRQAGDDYSAIMAKLLCDRLVEAMADTVLHGGCRIAVGYPSVPDHTLKRDIFDALGVTDDTDMWLTDSCMIVPGESICGLWLPQGRYIDIGVVSPDQLQDYARRRGLPAELVGRSIIRF